MINTQKSTFGRTRSGRSPWPGALLIGVALTGVVAGIAALTNDGERSWLLPLLLTASCLPMLTMLGWSLLVDRNSLKGSIANPDESIESTWYDAATRGCFHDILIVAGLTLTAVSIVPALHGLSAQAALSALSLFIAADVVVRYVIAKHRDA